MMVLEKVKNLRSGIGVKFLVGAIAIAVLGFGWQKACKLREAQMENERIAAYQAEIAITQADFQKNIDQADAEQKKTEEILDTIAEMTKSINALNENDKRMSTRVKELATGDYFEIRNQKSGQPTIKEKRRPNRNLRQREEDIMNLDAQLYPR